MASMGPRSIDRGTQTGISRIRITTLLQWGRDQLIAELWEPTQDLGDQALLQWGRDQLIAELDKNKLRSCGKSVLQWGRDQLIAELTPPG
jgi:hypothetical protein